MSLDLQPTQDEICQWARDNFGHNESLPLTNYNESLPANYSTAQLALGSLAPLLGIGEEIGELAEAELRGSPTDYLDALGDIGIYLCDYCGREGIHISTLPSLNVLQYPRDFLIPMLTSAYGQLLHATLKFHQGIRDFSNLEHYQTRRDRTLHLLLDTCKSIGRDQGKPFETQVIETWQKIVSKRDWKKAQASGGDITHQNQK